MSERPSRLPCRTELGRPGDALRDESPAVVLPETRELITQHAPTFAKIIAELSAVLKQQLAQVEDTPKARSEMLAVQTQALVHLTFTALRHFPAPQMASMLTYGMQSTSPEHGQKADKFVKRLEKMRARGENVDHLVPPGMTFDAKGRLVPMEAEGS